MGLQEGRLQLTLGEGSPGAEGKRGGWELPGGLCGPQVKLVGRSWVIYSKDGLNSYLFPTEFPAEFQQAQALSGL